MKKFTQVIGCRGDVVQNYALADKNPFSIDMRRIVVGVMAGLFLIAIGLTASCYIG